MDFFLFHWQNPLYRILSSPFYLKMTVDLASQLISQMIWSSVIVALPILGVALIVGLLVSIFQVITQIQEMSLSFIPKMGAVVVTIVLLGPWMIKKVMAFAITLISNIPTYI